MAETRQNRPEDRAPRRRWHRVVLAITVGLAVFFAAVLYRVTDRSVAVPAFARGIFVERLNTALAPLQVDVASMSVSLNPGSGPPRVSFRGIGFVDPDGARMGGLDRVVATLSGPDLRRGRIRLQTIQLSGATLEINRAADGRFSVSFGDAGGEAFDAAGAMLDVFGAVESSLSPPALSLLTRIESTGTQIHFDDAVTGRTWRFDDGRILLAREGAKLTSSIAFTMDAEETDPTTISFGWSKELGQRAARIEAKFTDLPSDLLSEQVAALNWLGIISAPIAGSVAADLSGDGTLGDFQGVLDIGSGRLTAAAAGTAGFDGAKAYFSYDAERQKITFNEINLATDDIRLQASGSAYIRGNDAREITALLGQFRFTRLSIDPQGLFEAPVKFTEGAVDLRVVPEPFRVDIGQIVLLDGETRISGSGQVGVSGDGVTASAEFTIPAITPDRVLALWPVGLNKKPRAWLSANILGGELQDVKGSIRVVPGEKPRLALGFRILDMGVRFIKTLPPVTGAYGYGVITGTDLSIKVESGQIVTATGQALDVSGSSFLIPDTRPKPAPGQVALNLKGRLKAVLSLLDEPPFEFLSKGKVPLDIADGDVEMKADIGLILKEKVLPPDVQLSAGGTITGATSERIVPGKHLRAERLRAVADNTGLTISGPAIVGAASFDGAWRQNFGPEHKGRSRFEAQVDLTDESLREFGIALPPGYIGGKGIGTLEIDLVKDKPPAFRLRSDLNRITLAVPPVGWSKPKNERGSLDVGGTFGNPTRIDWLNLKTKGFEFTGSVALKPGNKLDTIRFASVNIGDWYKGSARIVADGGTVALAIDGGSLDFRRARFGIGGNDAGIPVSGGLDRFQITETVALTDVQARLSTAGGVTGTFTGRINGGAPIEGTLAPARGGVRVRAGSADAGAALRSAGLFKDARGGTLDLALVPGGAARTYLGEVAIKDTRVRNVPALAELLNAISVVGLLEQLNGEGIGFSAVESRFRIGPDQVEVIDGNAIGPSMGLTMEGVYDTRAGRADMRGVITPFYVLNGIFEQTKLFGGLLGKKRGEGVVGITYRLKGAFSDPDVLVNPFSILTPGVFREIFNSPPPRVRE